MERIPIKALRLFRMTTVAMWWWGPIQGRFAFWVCKKPDSRSGCLGSRSGSAPSPPVRHNLYLRRPKLSFQRWTAHCTKPPRQLFWVAPPLKPPAREKDYGRSEVRKRVGEVRKSNHHSEVWNLLEWNGGDFCCSHWEPVGEEKEMLDWEDEVGIRV